jgi:hypothetical protein
MHYLEQLLAADTTKILAGAVLLMVAIPFILLRRKGRTVISLGSDNGIAMESAARTKVIEEELARHRKDLYEMDGAVRRGDHNVRNEIASLILREGGELGKKLDALAAEVHALEVRIAEQGNCCEHCK